MMNARSHFSRKLETKPKFVKVRINDIEKDIPNDINNPNRIVEYLLFIFITNPCLSLWLRNLICDGTLSFCLAVFSKNVGFSEFLVCMENL